MRIRLIFVVTFLIFFTKLYASSDLIFSYIGIDNGLSNNTIICFAQDENGLMWIGTNDGLDMFNSSDFTVFSNNDNENSISNNRIKVITIDSKQRLWVGTDNGLNLFDKEKFCFKRFFHSKKGNSLNSSDNINTIFEYNGNLLIGTDHGIKKLDEKRSDFTSFYISKNPSLSHENISSIKQDSKGNIWVGTVEKLYCFDNKFNLIIQFPKVSNISWGNNSIIEDKAGNIWVSFDQGITKITREKNKFVVFNDPLSMLNKGNVIHAWSLISNPLGNILVATTSGLIEINQKNNQIIKYVDDYKYGSLNSSNIRCVFYDITGNLWVGTDNKGIDINYINRKKIQYYVKSDYSPYGIEGDAVKGIFQDFKGNLWIGSDILSCYNEIKKKYINFPSVTNIISITGDNKQQIWVATEYGVYRINANSGLIKHYFNNTLGNNGKNIAEQNYMHNILVDKNGNVWAASWGGGLSKYNSKEDRFVRLENKNIDDYIKFIVEDSEGSIWCGNDKGVKQFDKNLIVRTVLKNKTEKRDHLTGMYVYCFFQDKIGNYWIGTNAGVNKYNPKTRHIEVIGKKDGLISEVICGITQDTNGFMWFSTNNGLVRFDPISKKIKILTQKDGLLTNQFSQNSIFKNKYGRVFFGGIKGVISFLPGELKENGIPPKIVFNDFRIFNKSVLNDKENSPLDKHINEMSEITLSYKQSEFSLDFVAINFGIGNSVTYAYKLDNFDTEWQEVKNIHSATYANLKSGKYIFHVKAANEDGVWSKSRSIVIKVLPPPWLKWYAFLFYFFVIIFLLLFARRIIITRQVLVNEIKLKEKENEQEIVINDMKLQFFTSISHEFRTPLTLIQGPLELLMATANRSTKEYSQYEIMEKSLHRLMSMITQLLEFRKVEKGKMKLVFSRNDIVLFVKNLSLNFKELSIEKNIKLILDFPSKELFVYFDILKFEIAIYNILSNAFKFTPKNGVVTVKLIDDKENDSVIISIQDTGQGIETGEFTKIFERFYQVNNSKINGGTGIGLSLARDIVLLHKGDISVESKLGIGTTFQVNIKTGKDHLFDSVISENGKSIDNYVYMIAPELPIGLNILSKNENLNDESLKKIVVVEDNDEIRSFIVSLLSNEYNIFQFANGKDAYEYILLNNTDLVITDILMPVIDGLELTRMLRKELRTCHIPIIMLTAKCSVNEEIDGYKFGADAYISKPFNNELLKSQIKNLLILRKQIKYHFLVAPKDDDYGKSSLPTDELFLKRFYEYLEKNISDPNLRTDSIAAYFSLSKVQLYRKLMAQSNQSTNALIKSYRLQRAKELIIENKLNISEIAYSVGFTDSLYFSKCFKLHFGVSPSHFMNKSSN